METKKSSYNKSPYTLLSEWFFDNNINSTLDDYVLKGTNHRAVLCMFGNLGKITIFLNDYFNAYNIMLIDKFSFYKMLKEIIIKKNITKYQLSFYKLESKDDKIIVKLKKKYPYLKSYEIDWFLKKIQGTDEYHLLMEIIGEEEVKKKKLTKAEKDKLPLSMETTSEPPKKRKGRPKKKED